MHTSPSVFFFLRERKKKRKEKKKNLVKYPGILGFECVDSESTLFKTVDSSTCSHFEEFLKSIMFTAKLLQLFQWLLCIPILCVYAFFHHMANEL